MRAVHAVCLSAICLICTLPCAAAARKWRGKGGGGGGAPAAKASASTDYDEVDCQKCMAQARLRAAWGHYASAYSAASCEAYG